MTRFTAIAESPIIPRNPFPRTVSVSMGKSAPKAANATREAFSVVSLFSGCGGLDLGFRGGFKALGRSYKRLPFRTDWRVLRKQIRKMGQRFQRLVRLR